MDPQPGTEFVVFDRSPHLEDIDDIVYRLFYKGPGEAWRMLAEQTIALGTSRGPTRLWSLYPNPARARVVIPFSSGRGGHARLTVHDVTGREVALVFEGSLRPGSGQWNWSGEDARGVKLAAGVYVVRLATEQGVQARKVVLLEE